MPTLRGHMHATGLRLVALLFVLAPWAPSAEAIAAPDAGSRAARLDALIQARLAVTRRTLDDIEALAVALRGGSVACPAVRLVLPDGPVAPPTPTPAAPPTATPTVTPLPATVTPSPAPTAPPPATGTPVIAEVALTPGPSPHTTSTPEPAANGARAPAPRSPRLPRAGPPGRRYVTSAPAIARVVFGHVPTRRDLFGVLAQAPRLGGLDPWGRQASPGHPAMPSRALAWYPLHAAGQSPGEAITAAGMPLSWGRLLRDRSGATLLRALLWLLDALAREARVTGGLAAWVPAPAMPRTSGPPALSSPRTPAGGGAGSVRRTRVLGLRLTRASPGHSPAVVSQTAVASPVASPSETALPLTGATVAATATVTPAATVDAVPLTRTVALTVTRGSLSVATTRGSVTTTFTGTAAGSVVGAVWVTSVVRSQWDGVATERAAALLRAGCRGPEWARAAGVAADLQALAGLQARGERLNALLRRTYRSLYGAFVANLTAVAGRNSSRHLRWMGVVWRYRAYTQRYREWAAREKSYWLWSAARYAHLVAVARWHTRKEAYDHYAAALDAYSRALPEYRAQVQAGTLLHLPAAPVEPPWPGSPPAFTWVEPIRLPRPYPVPIPPAPPWLEPLPLPPAPPPQWNQMDPLSLRGLGRGALVLPFAATYVAASAATGVPVAVLLAQDDVESSFRPWVDQGQHQGLGQMGALERRRFGVADSHDPVQSILGQARYDALLYSHLGSWNAVFAAYNEGEGGYRAHGAAGVETYRDGSTYLDRIAAALESLTRGGWLAP